jgi:hypothetical protein
MFDCRKKARIRIAELKIKLLEASLQNAENLGRMNQKQEENIQLERSRILNQNELILEQREAARLQKLNAIKEAERLR